MVGVLPANAQPASDWPIPDNEGRCSGTSLGEGIPSYDEVGGFWGGAGHGQDFAAGIHESLLLNPGAIQLFGDLSQHAGKQIVSDDIRGQERGQA